MSQVPTGPDLPRIRAEGMPCPNCGHALQAGDQYCAECGQDTRDLHRPIASIFREFASVELGWDAKLWTTLRRLLIRPGSLTLDLMNGRRRGQVPPVRLYLFISVVYFLLLNMSIHRDFERIGQERFGNDRQVLAENDTISLGGMRITVSDAQLYRDMSDAQLDSVAVARGSEPSAINRAFMKRAARFTDLQGIEQAFALMLQNLSYLLFLLMPMMGVLFWIFFKRRRPWYIDHLFMAIHVHCFFFLLQAVLLTIDLVTPVTTWGMGLPALLIYIPLATKRAYGMRWPATIVRSVLVYLLQISLVLGAFIAAMVIAFFRM